MLPRMLRPLVVAASLTLATSPAGALSSLADVIAGGGFTTSSGLTFDNFSALFLGLPIGAGSLFVDVGESGFSLFGPIGAADGEVGSVQLRFDVWAAESTEIIGAALLANVQATQEASALVSETIVGGGTTHTLKAGAGGGAEDNTDEVSFAGLAHAAVTKDIVVDSAGVGGSARISLVTQDFRVGQSPIPEPSGALLGLVGFVLVGRYLKRS